MVIKTTFERFSIFTLTCKELVSHHLHLHNRKKKKSGQTEKSKTFLKFFRELRSHYKPSSCKPERKMNTKSISQFTWHRSHGARKKYLQSNQETAGSVVWSTWWLNTPGDLMYASWQFCGFYFQKHPQGPS